jgi:transposase-like protein
MPTNCLHCARKLVSGSYFVRFGFFYRTGDSRWIQRYRCVGCKFTCSNASFRWWFREKKRAKNLLLKKHLAGTGSLRRAAKYLHLNRKTVARKLLSLGFEAEYLLHTANVNKPPASVIEFDDLETFEHTKCKPLSITLAVESATRRILGIEVSTMPAKGLLVEKAKKYGPRLDGRRKAREVLFKRLQGLVREDVVIKSDNNPHYPSDVARFFPKAKHITYAGKRGSLGGQGELKKVRFDPLFSLNHTCAMLRANVNRLIRKTWCTTKRADRLRAHLMIYAQYHNEELIR